MADRGCHYRTVDRPDARATSVRDLDHFQCGQRVERFAHDRPAHAEIGRKAAFARQHVADFEAVRADVFADRVRGGFDQRTLGRTDGDLGQAAIPVRRNSEGATPKRRVKARVKLALLR